MDSDTPPPQEEGQAEKTRPPSLPLDSSPVKTPLVSLGFVLHGKGKECSPFICGGGILVTQNCLVGEEKNSNIVSVNFRETVVFFKDFFLEGNRLINYTIYIYYILLSAMCRLMPYFE